jgi:hypothetical protein
MPRGKRGQVTIQNEAGEEVVAERVNASCLLAATDAQLLREYAKHTDGSYMEWLSRVLSEALSPYVQVAREALQERESVLQEKVARAEELKRLIEEHREELRKLEREAGRR